MTLSLQARDLVMTNLNPVMGREPGGRRPALVVSHARYQAIPGRFLAVPLTTTDRRLPHHVLIHAGGRTGLDRDSYVMTEQMRALSVARAERSLGRIDEGTWDRVSRYLHLFIG